MMKTFIFATAQMLLICGMSIGQCLLNPRTNIFENLGGGPCVNAIPTAVPFLNIIPDARSGAMGDAGIATSPTAFAQYHNNSKIPFSDRDFEASASYVPWLRSLGLSDVFLAYLSTYKKINPRQAVGFGLKYFSLGDIQFTSANGSNIGFGRPHEYEISLGYTRKLGERLSAGVTGKYISSNLGSGQLVGGIEINAAKAGALDLSIYHHRPHPERGLSWGIVLQNLGSKISYTQVSNDYLPAQIGLGLQYLQPINLYNSVAFTGEIRKLLVPTPQHTLVDQNPANGTPDYREQPLFRSILRSFYDAPEGLTEELHEIMYSVGLEYWYDRQFAVRGGFFHEHQLKGARQYLTVGIGLRYQVFGIDLSYLVSTSPLSQSNPLDKTFRFSFLFGSEVLTPP